MCTRATCSPHSDIIRINIKAEQITEATKQAELPELMTVAGCDGVKHDAVTIYIF